MPKIPEAWPTHKTWLDPDYHDRLMEDAVQALLDAVTGLPERPTLDGEDAMADWILKAEEAMGEVVSAAEALEWQRLLAAT